MIPSTEVVSSSVPFTIIARGGLWVGSERYEPSGARSEASNCSNEENAGDVGEEKKLKEMTNYRAAE